MKRAVVAVVRCVVQSSADCSCYSARDPVAMDRVEAAIVVAVVVEDVAL